MNPPQTEPKAKGVSTTSLLLLLLLTAIVFTGVGIVLAQYVLPDNLLMNNPVATVTPSVEDDGMAEYVSEKYGFTFTYPDTWQVREEDKEPTYRGVVELSKGDYSILFKIMTYPGMDGDWGWGPEACIYSDSIANLDDYVAVGYVQYDDFEQIDNGHGSFRRSQIEDSGLWIVCSSGSENEDTIYSTDSFLPIDYNWVQDASPLTGFIEYHTPTVDVSQDTLMEMDLILQSVITKQ